VGDPSSPSLLANPIFTQQWLPGDTLRFPVRLDIEFQGIDTIGDFQIRYEYRVTVPEPSASLSLPIGALTLAGLSMMKGGA
jgi:hypothetical protein